MWASILSLASGLVGLLSSLAGLFSRKRDREAGANEERAKNLSSVTKQVEKANAASMSVDGLSDDELDRKLDKWSRD